MIMKLKIIKEKGTVVMNTQLLNILFPYHPKMDKNGNIRCDCPFREAHEENHGIKSFSISLEKNAYNCFSCGKSGSMMSLLTIKFKLPFSKACHVLSNREPLENLSLAAQVALFF